MAIGKRKLVVFFTIAALGGGALILCTGQNSSEQENPSRKTTGGRNSTNKTGSLFSNDPNLLLGSDSNLSSKEVFYKLMISVLLVAVLGAAAIYASKKLLPKLANLPGKRIHIIETVHLGPRRAIHLVEVGNQQLLIGSTNENITKLADVTFAFEELSVKDAHSDLEI